MDYKVLKECFLQVAVVLLSHQIVLLCSVCPSMIASDTGSSVKPQLANVFTDDSIFYRTLLGGIFRLVFV